MSNRLADLCGRILSINNRPRSHDANRVREGRPLHGLDPLELRLLLSANAYVYQYQVEIDTLYFPNVVSFDMPIDPDATYGRVTVTGFSDLDNPDETVTIDAEGLASGVLFDDATVPPGPLTEVYSFYNSDLTTMAADGNLHLTFTPSATVSEDSGVQESLHVELIYQVPSTPVALSPVTSSNLLAYEGTVQGTFSAVGEADGYSVALEAGQTLQMEVVPAEGLSLDLELVSPDLNWIHGVPAYAHGEALLMEPFQAQLTGEYTFSITSDGGTGDYAVNLRVNQAIEQEMIGGPSNDDLASSQDLDTLFFDHGHGTEAVVLHGTGSAYTPTATGEGAAMVESFETGIWPDGWSARSSYSGFIRLTTDVAGRDGSNALFMQSYSSWSPNEAIWTVDLDPSHQTMFSFSYAQWNDSSLSLPATYTGRVNGDGVSISDDGENWYTILNAPYSPSGVWQDITYDLNAEAAAAGMTLGTGFQIKFQQYGKGRIPSEGRGYDRIVLSNPDDVVVHSPLPDVYSFSLDADEYTSIQLIDPGGGPIAFDLLDGSAQSILPDGVSSSTGRASFRDFKSPAADQYYINVTEALGEYTLIVTRGATLETETNDTTETAQPIDRTGLVLGGIGDPADVAYFQIPVTAGDAMLFETLTPNDGFSGLNALDPALTLLDPDGTPVASDDNSAPDGRNVRLEHTAAVSGVYTLALSGNGTTGEFSLAASGYTGDPLNVFEASDSTNGEGRLIDYRPSYLILNFSDIVSPSSLDPAAFTVNGVPTTSITRSGTSNTYYFDTPLSAYVEGLNIVSLAGGTVRNLYGDPVQPYTLEITIDTIPPNIIESSVSNHDVFVDDEFTITLKFSDPITGPLLGTGAHTKLDTTSTESFVAYDPEANELTATYTGLSEGRYLFTLTDYIINTSWLGDPAGNYLDGEVNPTTTVPSGNGVDGGDFNLTFYIDEEATEVTPVSFTPLNRDGSFAYLGSFNGQARFIGDKDRYTMSLTDGQVFSMVLDENIGEYIHDMSLTLLDPSGQVVATTDSSSGYAIAPTLITETGIYTILVEAIDVTSSASPGVRLNYTGKMNLNWIRENEPHSQSTNDDTASAEDLDPAMVLLESGIYQAVVEGYGDGGTTSDVYKVSLTAGEEFSAVLFDSVSSDAIQLLGPGGELITHGRGSWDDAAGLISGFVAPTSGDYFIRITGALSWYSLITTRGADFSPEPNYDSNETALGLSNINIGAIASSPSDYDIYSFQAEAGDGLTLWTSTPGSGLPDAPNTLDTYLELRGPDGYLRTELGSGGDGLNALINYTADVAGLYTVRILSQNATTGSYILHMTGATVGVPTYEVASTSLPEGTLLSSEPTQLSVNLSGPVRFDTVDPGDLLVNGVPALGVSVTDLDTVLFDLPTGLGEGTYNITLSAGSVLDLAGNPIQAYAQQVMVDLIAPRVISSSIQQDDVLTPGAVIVTIQFDEELSTYSLSGSDVSLYGEWSDDLTIDGFNYEPSTSTLTLQLLLPQEDIYQLRIDSGAYGFRDLSGNNLDGETPAWPIPTNVSGDGVPGGAFTVIFSAEHDGPRPIYTPTQITPLGSLAMMSQNNRGIITNATDTDTFEVYLETGQSMIAVLDTTYGGVDPTLTGPTGVLGEPAPGEPIVLRYTHTDPSGVIQLDVNSQQPSEYLLDVYLNTEFEAQLSTVADPAGEALDLNPHFIGGYATGIDVATILGTGQPHTTLTDLGGLYAPRSVSLSFTDMTMPTGDGTLTISAIGDLGEADEYLSISGESGYQADVFQSDGAENALVSTSLTIPQATLELMAANGTISFTVTPSDRVGDYSGSELTLSLSYPGMPLPPVDAYAVDLQADQVASVIVHDIEQSTGLFTVELIDALTGVVVATGVTEGGYDAVVQALRAPAAGRYHIRVHTPGVQDYSLTVLRGAALETEHDDTPGLAPPTLDDTDAVQGYLRNLGEERLFVTDLYGSSDEVFEVDPQTLQIVNRIKLTDYNGNSLYANELMFDGDSLLVHDSSLNKWIAVDPDSGTMRGTLPTYAYRSISSYDGLGISLEYNNETDGQYFQFFDQFTGEVVREVQVDPLRVDGTAIVGAASRGSVFVVEYSESSSSVISEVDADTGQILSSFPLVTRPFYMDVAYANGKLYVSDRYYRRFTAYDVDTGQIVSDSQPSWLQGYVALVAGVGVAPIQDQDRYAITLQPGERVTLSTVTPFDHPLAGTNSLDPAISVFDPNGAPVAFDDNTAPDGKNAQLTFTANLPGIYEVQVTAPSGTGEYVLHASRDQGLPGDVTGDGFVGVGDLNTVLANWNQAVAPGDLSSGDVTGDGFVGIQDLNTVLGNWNASVTPPEVPGDVTGDGFVGVADLNVLLTNWNTDASGDPRADLTGDNFVGVADLNLILANWNLGTPPAQDGLALAVEQLTARASVQAASTQAATQAPAQTSDVQSRTASTHSEKTTPQRSVLRGGRFTPTSGAVSEARAGLASQVTAPVMEDRAAMAAWSRRQRLLGTSGPDKMDASGYLMDVTAKSPLGLWEDHGVQIDRYPDSEPI
jgi:hypothetical protein